MPSFKLRYKHTDRGTVLALECPKTPGWLIPARPHWVEGAELVTEHVQCGCPACDPRDEVEPPRLEEK